MIFNWSGTTERVNKVAEQVNSAEQVNKVAEQVNSTEQVSKVERVKAAQINKQRWLTEQTEQNSTFRGLVRFVRVRRHTEH